MSFHRYSTALSHFILAVVCAFCLKSYGVRDWKRFPLGTYGLTFVNSILGVWYWGNPLHGKNVEKPYKLTLFLLVIFSLPFIVTDTWLRNGYKKELAYAHAAASLLPLVQYFAAKVKQDVVDIIIAINILSLVYVGFSSENYFGITTAVSFAINHFILAKERDFLNVPPEDVYNYGLCFFAYFALRTITTNC